MFVLLNIFMSQSFAENHDDPARAGEVDVVVDTPTQVILPITMTSAPLLGNAFEWNITNASFSKAKLAVVEFIDLDGNISSQTTGTGPVNKSNSFELGPWKACYV